MDDLLQDFIAEARSDLATADAHLASLASCPADPEVLAGVFRIFHSVKGTSGFLGLDALGALAHEAETLLGELREGEAGAECLATTLALTERCKAALLSAEQSGRASSADPAAELRKSGSEPLIEAALRGLPSRVHKLAALLGKRIATEVDGEPIALDRRTFRLLRTALVHLVRNAADHGLESPAERKSRGKAEVGTIRIRAREHGDRVVVAMADDGRGLATEKIAAAAMRAGLATSAEIAAMDEAQIQRLVFAPGLSTAPVLTHVSGRGIGMDVVEAAMDLLGGAVELHSIEGQGTTFTLTFPRSGARRRRARPTRTEQARLQQ